MKRKPGFSLFGLAAIFIIAFVLCIAALAVAGQLLGGILGQKKCIAEVRLENYITDSREDASIFSPEPPPNSKEIVKRMREMDGRDDVAAIVLLIDSPGGEVIASREIYESARDSKKPVVAYLRNIATSGGYYAAVGSDHIISEPETVTGSIGVRATFISFEGMFGNLGINYTTIKSGDKKDMGDIGSNLSDEEVALLREFIDDIFQDFRSDVVSARAGRPRFSEEKFNEVLDGRFISGRKAYSIGLVDGLGNSDAAYEKAAELAGIEEYEKCTSRGSGGILRSFMETLSVPLGIHISVESDFAKVLGQHAPAVSYS